jgi:uncharacterized Zn finger protein
MKAKDPARFDIDALRELAGAKVFARGQEYHRDGSVQLLSLNSKRVLAQVAGTEDYRTVLTGRGADIGGECSCRAFADWGFCKHMVATALAVNAAGDGAEAEAAGALSRIRDHLKRKGIDALVDLVLELAEEDQELFRKLDMASAVAKGDAKTFEARLRKAIDGATRTGAYVDYREAPRWRDGVDAALDAVADLATGGHAGVALKLVERAIERIEAAFEAIDDSDGHLGALLEHARDIHLAAASAVRPEPVALARDLFERETNSDFETFFGAAELYADVLGDKGLAEYRRLAAAAWDKLPARSGKVRGGDTSFGSFRLMHILDFFAGRDGDVDARVALRAKNLSSQWDYLQLAEFCLSQGRGEEALRRAEEGLWLFEDEGPDERLLFFTAGLLAKAGRKADASAHLWRAFEKEPGLDIYKQLLKFGGRAAADRAIDLAEKRAAGRRRSVWDRNADLLVEILMHDKQFDAAWSAAKKFDASASVKQELARASDRKHPGEALEVYAVEVEHLAGHSNYDEAAKVIARMEKIRSAAEQAAYVADLKVRHKRKRNFMRLLG